MAKSNQSIFILKIKTYIPKKMLLMINSKIHNKMHYLDNIISNCRQAVSV